MTAALALGSSLGIKINGFAPRDLATGAEGEKEEWVREAERKRSSGPGSPGTFFLFFSVEIKLINWGYRWDNGSYDSLIRPLAGAGGEHDDPKVSSRRVDPNLGRYTFAFHFSSHIC